ncbi:hypothetical protein B0H10DRAFT_1963715 [Mycena sp. CBHHK59/15]|nr:hypothetical protein B0H10DRAFT_1963715 [Mycena sp. CBHHK59/15]
MPLPGDQAPTPVEGTRTTHSLLLGFLLELNLPVFHQLTCVHSQPMDYASNLNELKCKKKAYKIGRKAFGHIPIDILLTCSQAHKIFKCELNLLSRALTEIFECTEDRETPIYGLDWHLMSNLTAITSQKTAVSDDFYQKAQTVPEYPVWGDRGNFDQFLELNKFEIASSCFREKVERYLQYLTNFHTFPSIEDHQQFLHDEDDKIPAHNNRKGKGHKIEENNNAENLLFEKKALPAHYATASCAHSSSHGDKSTLSVVGANGATDNIIIYHFACKYQNIDHHITDQRCKKSNKANQCDTDLICLPACRTPLILTQAELLAIAFFQRGPIHYQRYQGVRTMESTIGDEAMKNGGGKQRRHCKSDIRIPTSRLVRWQMHQIGRQGNAKQCMGMRENNEVQIQPQAAQSNDKVQMREATAVKKDGPNYIEWDDDQDARCAIAVKLLDCSRSCRWLTSFLRHLTVLIPFRHPGKPGRFFNAPASHEAIEPPRDTQLKARLRQECLTNKLRAVQKQHDALRWIQGVETPQAVAPAESELPIAAGASADTTSPADEHSETTTAPANLESVRRQNEILR